MKVKENINKYKAVLYAAFILLIVLLDQYLKWYVVNEGGFFIIKDFLDIGLYKNFGTAFGIPIPYYILYPLIAFALILISYRYLRKLKQGDMWIAGAYILVLAGALDNLFDRIYRGYVVDYIHFSFGSVFNIADVMIVVGVGMLLVREFKSPITKSSFGKLRTDK